MADVLLSINEDESDPLIKENIDVSVPTDLTVSVSVPSYSHQEISEASSLLPDQVSKAPPITEEVTVKRLRSELQFQKLSLAQKDADLDRFQAERKKEVELLQRHVHLSSRENEALQKENHVATERIVELQINNSKYVGIFMYYTSIYSSRFSILYYFFYLKCIIRCNNMCIVESFNTFSIYKTSYCMSIDA